eukprot:TRINITY_DN25056_c0_g1_i2.p1 TRINITY_DN25056_c0_g1~~TRINITY_DN25056_c0_g1_i2.p1  ORF type:complete len:295 (+),score=104.86 TRINITY_DN25056_c0_g1_i2:43-927(+)
MLGLIVGGAGLALFSWTCVLRMRIKALNKLAGYWFGVVTMFTLLSAFVIVKIASFVLPRRTLESVACRTAKTAFALTLLLNPQVSVRSNIEWNKLPSRCMLLLNHTSWFDSVLFTAVVPFFAIAHFRTLLKSTLLSLPLGGEIFKSAGHFPVYFMKDEDGSWAVDKDKQAPVTERMNEFIRRPEAVLSFYPEGVVNKTPEKLQTFRRGSFVTPIEHDLPIYGFLAVGNDITWPAGGFPGQPADIDVRLFEVVEKTSKLPEEMQNPQALSEHCHVVMQKELDSMLAERNGGKKSN